MMFQSAYSRGVRPFSHPCPVLFFGVSIRILTWSTAVGAADTLIYLQSFNPHTHVEYGIISSGI